jgi:hypothetical protein
MRAGSELVSAAGRSQRTWRARSGLACWCAWRETDRHRDHASHWLRARVGSLKTRRQRHGTWWKRGPSPYHPPLLLIGFFASATLSVLGASVCVPLCGGGGGAARPSPTPPTHTFALPKKLRLLAPEKKGQNACARKLKESSADHRPRISHRICITEHAGSNAGVLGGIGEEWNEGGSSGQCAPVRRGYRDAQEMPRKTRLWVDARIL